MKTPKNWYLKHSIPLWFHFQEFLEWLITDYVDHLTNRIDIKISDKQE